MLQSTEKNTPTETKPSGGLGIRHLQFLLSTICLIVAYGIRTNMSVGIIAMMERDPENPNIITYPNWTKQQKESILSAFFWGYIVPQIGAGQLNRIWGPKWILVGAMVVNSLATLAITPMAESAGVMGVIGCRVVQGFAQGFLYPSLHTVLSAWTPPADLSKVGSFVYTGGPLGTALSLPITGLIANSSAGWPTGFYVYGAAGLLWCVLWAWLGADTPQSHPSISTAERKYIEECLAKKEKKQLRIGPTPWRKIATSLPFWAIFISHCGQNWSFWTLLTEIPSYMSSILKFDIKENSLLSSLPYFMLWLLNFLFSYLADYFVVKNYLSLTNTRKLFNSIGLFLPAIALTWLAFVKEGQKDLALTLLVIAVGIDAAVYSGFNVNHLDLAPNYGGILMGITNSLSNILSIIAPLSLNYMGHEEDDPILWRIVFCLSAGINVAAGIFYALFASGEVQSWNHNEEDTQDEQGIKSSH